MSSALEYGEHMSMLEKGGPDIALMCHCACHWVSFSGCMQGIAAPWELSLGTWDTFLTI